MGFSQTYPHFRISHKSAALFAGGSGSGFGRCIELLEQIEGGGNSFEFCKEHPLKARGYIVVLKGAIINELSNNMGQAVASKLGVS